MIVSDRQYSVSQAELEKLRHSLEESSANGKGAKSWISDLHSDALREQIAEMTAELAEYDLLKSGQISLTETSSLSELPRILVQARISQGLSQTDLAEKLGMKPQQIQRYESSNYMSASLSRLIEVADILGVRISESFETARPSVTGAIFSWADVSEVVWSRFPVKEMARRGWLKIDKTKNAVDSVRDFFLSRAGPQFASALHRKKVRAGNIPNEYALLAWQARVLQRAKGDFTQGRLGSFDLKDTWISELVALTQSPSGPLLAKQLLAEQGIALVIEPHLSGTYLDGAAMLMDTGNPLIAMTLRHDRLDNFWFVLFHELGHVMLHLFDNTKFDFFDEEDGAETDSIEGQADKFALDTLIPNGKWELCLSRFTLSNEAVRIDAHNLGIAESIIAGRIRKERNNYTILNDLVGHRAVREQFEEIKNGD